MPRPPNMLNILWTRNRPPPFPPHPRKMFSWGFFLGGGGWIRALLVNDKLLGFYEN